MLTQAQFLEPLARHRTDQIVISAMSLVRAWGRLSKHELDFAFTDSAMGHAQSLALGLALAQPQRRVICLNGDGSMLMSLGALVTIAQCRARNLILFVAQNNTYEVTGNQTTPGARGGISSNRVRVRFSRSVSFFRRARIRTRPRQNSIFARTGLGGGAFRARRRAAPKSQTDRRHALSARQFGGCRASLKASITK